MDAKVRVMRELVSSCFVEHIKGLLCDGRISIFFLLSIYYFYSEMLEYVKCLQKRLLLLPCITSFRMCKDLSVLMPTQS